MTPVTKIRLQALRAYWLNNSFGAIYGCALLFLLVIYVLSIVLSKADSSVFALLISAFIFCAVIWQSIRLQSTEWHKIVPGYSQYMVKQLWFIVGLSHALILVIICMTQDWQTLLKLTYPVLFGSVFLVICVKRSDWYNIITLCYAVLVNVIISLPTPSPLLAASSCVVAGILFAVHRNKVLNDNWSAHALNTYQTASKSGWLPIPERFISLVTLSKVKTLFPLSYFTGTALVITLVMWPLLLGLLVIASFILPSEHELLLIISCHLSLFFGFYICWGMVKNLHSWRGLLLLPLFEDKTKMVQGIVTAKRLLLLFIFATSLLATTIIWLTSESINLPHIIVYSVISTLGLGLLFVISYQFPNSASLTGALFTLLILLPVIQGLVFSWANWPLSITLLAIALVAVMERLQVTLIRLFNQSLEGEI